MVKRKLSFLLDLVLSSWSFDAVLSSGREGGRRKGEKEGRKELGRTEGKGKGGEGN